MLGDCDVVSVAGGVKDLVSPASPHNITFLLRQIDVSQRLHGIANIILVNHTDCGAYGAAAAFNSAEQEVERHSSDLALVKARIKERYPDMEIISALAYIEADGAVRIEELLQ